MEFERSTPEEVVTRLVGGDLSGQAVDAELARAMMEVALRPDLGEDQAWANILLDVLGEQQEAGLLDFETESVFHEGVVACLRHDGSWMRAVAVRHAASQGLLRDDPYVYQRVSEIAQYDPSDMAATVAADVIERMEAEAGMADQDRSE
ncbi:MAG: hypothetical protein AAF235_01180 [Planctomycetota bacterium]